MHKYFVYMTRDNAYQIVAYVHARCESCDHVAFKGAIQIARQHFGGTCDVAQCATTRTSPYAFTRIAPNVFARANV